MPIPNKKALVDILAFEIDEKLALLSIAHQFVFDKIFEYICGELEPEEISVVDRVRLGDKYCLDKWLSSAYKDILKRTPDENLSQEEANALGVKRVVKVLEAKNSILFEVYREHVGRSSSNGHLRCAGCNKALSCRYCSVSRGRHSTTGADEEDPTTAMRIAIIQAAEKHVL